MNFDIKDIKSWSNRHDVKVGDVGYFADSLLVLGDRVSMDCRGVIGHIRDRQACCFKIKNDNDFCFFLPLNSVKEEKKYRPFESMEEFTKVVYNLVPDYLSIAGVGESFMARRKCNGHYEKVLITHLEYDENHDLLSINGQSLKSWFENYEVITDDDKIIPFGIEATED